MIRAADIIILAVVALAAVCYWWGRQRWRRTGTQKPGRRHSGAARLLEEKGYQVLAYDVQVPVTVAVDGKAGETRVGCDLTVRRDGDWFAVVLRRGDGWRLTAELVRRRLLELVCALQPDGILLVDPEAGKVREIRIKIPAARRWQVGPLVTGLVAGVVLCLFVLWRGGIL